MTRREKELTSQLAECQAALAQSRRENELLRQKIDLLVRRVFGSSSERLDRAQLELLLQLPESVANPEPVEPSIIKKPSGNARKERQPRLPENLPVVEEVIDPEPVKAAPQSWRCIGQEVSEQLDFEPARFLRRRTIRRKYVHRVNPDGAPLIAPLPEGLWIAACRRQGCWRIFWSANTATTCRCTGRNKFFFNATGFICPGKLWPAGWGWPPIGSSQFMNTSAPESWLAAMCRWMKRRLIIWRRATARPSKVISGRAAVRAATYFPVGNQPCRCVPGQRRSRQLHRHAPMRWLFRLSHVCQWPRPSDPTGRVLGARAAEVLRSPGTITANGGLARAPNPASLPHRRSLREHRAGPGCARPCVPTKAAPSFNESIAP